MKISQSGIDFIKKFEGYLRKLPDGNCIAYRCPAGVLTIGHGVTEGVKAGMIWTPEQAEAALQRELAKHEAAVMRLCAIDLNQNQFDALVSFSYNCGSGALAKSTLLKKLNKGDFRGAQGEFLKWDKATVNGKRVALRGLSRRRAAEAALFAKRTAEEDAEKDPVAMPQAIEPPKEPMSRGAAVVAAAPVVVGGSEMVKALIPAPPPTISASVENMTTWQSLAKSTKDIAEVAWGYPVLSVGIAGLIIAAIWLPSLWSKEA